MAGIRFNEARQDHFGCRSSSAQSPSPSSVSISHLSNGSSIRAPQGSLIDPILQDLSHASRKYLSYFSTEVCKDLVLYDTPEHNPFRELIPLTYQYPTLLQIILANSAMRMSNASQSAMASYVTSPHRRPSGIALEVCERLPTFQRAEAYRDALVYKHQALRLLQSTLASLSLADIDVTLAMVLLFIEYELLDSGQDDWAHHLSAARTIITMLLRSEASTESIVSPLRRCLISNCMVFDILGTTLASSIGLVSEGAVSRGTLSLLQDTEGNHCSSLPTDLLQLLRRGGQLSQHTYSTCLPEGSLHTMQKEAATLLHAAETFEPVAWAISLRPQLPATDLANRVHVASAHQAAVRIYLTRTQASLDPTGASLQRLEPLVAEIISQLSAVRPSSALFTATTWPAFVAGAETNDCARQDWVAHRLQELWDAEPWGLIRGALGVLERMWEERRNQEASDGDGACSERSWIVDLKAKGVNWLIL